MKIESETFKELDTNWNLAALAKLISATVAEIRSVLPESHRRSFSPTIFFLYKQNIKILKEIIYFLKILFAEKYLRAS
jgi:hypothetical protein